MPKDNHKRNRAIRFPVELYERLVKAAEERDLSVNYLVNKAVEDFLPRLIPVDQFTLVTPFKQKVMRDLPSGHFQGYGRDHQIDPPCAWFSGGECDCSMMDDK